MQFDSSATNNWLPTFPSVAIRILEMFADEDVAIVDLANQVRLDPVLCAKLLHVANSPLYRSKREIASLEHAVSWLGKSEVAGLVLSFKMASFAADSGREAKYYNSFWRQSFVQGCAMMRIAECTGRIPQGEAYICGLLLDFGVMLMLDGYPTGYTRIMDESRDRGIPLHEVETSRLAINHAEIGQELLGNMGLPARYGVVAGLHTITVEELESHQDHPHFDLIVAAVASSAIGDFFCRNNQGHSLGTIEGCCRRYLDMMENDIEWLMDSVRSDIDEKAHLYSVDLEDMLPIGQLVGHANIQIQTAAGDDKCPANDTESHLRQENRVLRNLVASLENKVCKDSLTGIYSRDYFTGRLSERVNSDQFVRDSFALIIMDIDKFKSINDDLGHLAGDLAITWTAKFIDSWFRDGLVARFGGDEFVALIDARDEDEVQTEIETLCQEIRQLSADAIEQPNAITISAGAVFCRIDRPGCSLPIQLFDMADKAMYECKRQGGNRSRVVSMDDIPDAWTGSIDAVSQSAAAPVNQAAAAPLNTSVPAASEQTPISR